MEDKKISIKQLLELLDQLELKDKIIEKQSQFINELVKGKLEDCNFCKNKGE